MIHEYGNMFSILRSTDLFLITTNSTIKRSGAVVMGRGIAQRVRDRWPGIDIQIGKAITATTNKMYGLIVAPGWPKRNLGIFQVKYNYFDKASLDIIKYSTIKLCDWIKEHHPDRVDINYPGIGNGKLSVDQVAPIITILPDCVHVWRWKA